MAFMHPVGVASAMAGAVPVGASQGGVPAASGAGNADSVVEPLAKRPRTAPPVETRDPLACCGRVEMFRKLNRIDEGTYGVVYRALNEDTGEVVALKQLKLLAVKSDDGFPISSLREIALLLKLDHPHIVRCREVVVGKTPNHIFMVMEYVEHELRILLERHNFGVAEVKCLLKQLLCGVEYLHERWVLHRDLKTTNILLNNSGVLKICDFGLARHFGDPARTYTQKVQSLWYRAPELLMGQKAYTTSVDIWSVGCIFAEMLIKRPAFEGRAELHQLGLIFELTGVPTEESWPGYDALPNRRTVEFKLSLPRWRAVFPYPPEGLLTDTGLEMLRSLLECCPSRRATAETAHQDPYFWERPYPQEPGMMPTFQESNNVGRAARRPPARGGPPPPPRQVSASLSAKI